MSDVRVRLHHALERVDVALTDALAGLVGVEEDTAQLQLTGVGAVVARLEGLTGGLRLLEGDGAGQLQTRRVDLELNVERLRSRSSRRLEGHQVGLLQDACEHVDPRL